MHDPKSLAPRLEALKDGLPKSIWRVPISQVPKVGALKFQALSYKFQRNYPSFSWRAYDDLVYNISLLGLNDLDMGLEIHRSNSKIALESIRNIFEKAYLELLSNVKIVEITKEIRKQDLDYTKMLEPYYSDLCAYHDLIEGVLKNKTPEKYVVWHQEEIEKKNMQIKENEKRLRDEMKEKIMFESAFWLEKEGDKELKDMEKRSRYYEVAEKMLSDFFSLQYVPEEHNIAERLSEKKEKVHRLGCKQSSFLRDHIVRLWKQECQEEVKVIIDFLEQYLEDINDTREEFKELKNIFNTQKNVEEPIQVKKLVNAFLEEFRGGPLFSYFTKEYGETFENDKSIYQRFINDLRSGKLDFFLLGYEAFKKYGFGTGTYVEKILEEQLEEESPFVSSHVELGFTGDIRKFKQFLYPDPDLMFMRLAEKQQPYKRYMITPTHKKEVLELVQKTEYWEMDISGSMSGKRAEVRDALFCVRLNRHVKEAKEQKYFSPIYYQLFDDGLRTLVCIDNEQIAQKTINELIEYHRVEGGTNITGALLSSFKNIRIKDQLNAELSRATVVLVTDGDDSVSVKEIEKARKGIRDEIEIIFHFISIFHGNEDLKKLVLSQNADGEQGFYFHIDEQDLNQLGNSFKEEVEELHEYAEQSKQLNIPKQEFDASMVKVLEFYDRICSIIQQSKEVSTMDESEQLFRMYFPNNEVQFIDAQEVPTNQPETKVKGYNNTQLTKVEVILAVIADMTKYGATRMHKNDSVVLLEHLLETHGVSKETYLSFVLSQNYPRLVANVEKITKRTAQFDYFN